MMFCSQCGKEINDNSEFCSFCRNKIVRKEINSNKIKNRNACMHCGGVGTMRSTAKIILSVVVCIGLFYIQNICLGATIWFLDEGIVMVAITMSILLDSLILYWGVKKRMCPVCHGNGRIAV